MISFNFELFLSKNIFILFNCRKMDQVLVNAAIQLENQLDSEIERLDNLTVDDIDTIREKRLKEMRERQEKIIVWKANVRRS